MQYLAILKKYIDVSKIIKHTSSSLPATNFKNFRFDMVRLGIMLFASIKNNAKIKTLDAITIKSKIINIYKLQPGQSVGYNKGFVAKKPFRDVKWECMHASERALIGFPHLYYYSNPAFLFARLEQYIQACGCGS